MKFKSAINFIFIFITPLILLGNSNCLYFEVKGDKEKCFVDDFYKNSVVLIKYNIIGLDEKEEKSKN